MTWTKIGSELPDDPRLLQLPRNIRWMYVESMIWSNQHGTDGLIPRYALGRITDEPDTTAAAEAITAVGLWEENSAGWDIVGFLDDQPSAEDVERTNELARQRQRRRRQHINGDHSLCDARYCAARDVTRDVTRDSRVESAVSHDTRTDRTDRTVPTDREGRGGGEGKGAAPAANADSAEAPSATAPAPPGPWKRPKSRIIDGSTGKEWKP